MPALGTARDSFGSNKGAKPGGAKSEGAKLVGAKPGGAKPRLRHSRQANAQWLGLMD